MKGAMEEKWEESDGIESVEWGEWLQFKTR